MLSKTSGDKSADMLKGAIIGGILGNNVGDIKNGGAAGAIIGGMIGHNNSTATGGTQTVCQLETRYDEEQVSVYSHSVIKFEYNNRFTLRHSKYSKETKMTYEPDEYMSQPDGKIILEEHIKYIKQNDGTLVKETTTRRFYGAEDYQDGKSTTPLSRPDW